GAGQIAHPARLHGIRAARHRDGELAMIDDRRVVRLAGPAAVEHGERSGRSLELDVARAIALTAGVAGLKAVARAGAGRAPRRVAAFPILDDAVAAVARERGVAGLLRVLGAQRLTRGVRVAGAVCDVAVGDAERLRERRETVALAADLRERGSGDESGE